MNRYRTKSERKKENNKHFIGVERIRAEKTKQKGATEKDDNKNSNEQKTNRETNKSSSSGINVPKRYYGPPLWEHDMLHFLCFVLFPLSTAGHFDTPDQLISAGILCLT